MSVATVETPCNGVDRKIKDLRDVSNRFGAIYELLELATRATRGEIIIRDDLVVAARDFVLRETEELNNCISGLAESLEQEAR